MTFGYWSLCSIGSLYIIAYVWFFILIFIHMCQIWGLKFKDKNIQLGTRIEPHVERVAVWDCLYVFSQKKLRRKMKSAEWLEGHQTWLPADPGRKWIPETMKKTLQWLSVRQHFMWMLETMEPGRKQLFPKLLCSNKVPNSLFLLFRDWCCALL